MVRHTLKILQHLQQEFQSASDHFTTLRSKGLKTVFLVLILQSTCFICITWKRKQTMEQLSPRACEWTKSNQNKNKEARNIQSDHALYCSI